MTFKEWIIDLFEDERGAVSIKPLIALMGSLFLCVTMTVNAVSHNDFAPSDTLVDAVLVITIIGMGSDSLDKFSFKQPKKTPEQINENQEQN
jgi:hypothetical protein